jgi:hypothetical protein
MVLEPASVGAIEARDFLRSASHESENDSHPNESVKQRQLGHPNKSSTEGLDAIFVGTVVCSLDGVFYEPGTAAF